jgi:limonene 1,2-monooxygenase
MDFGIFMAPFHPVGQNPTLALERDLELIQHLDRLGFDEAWVGEHHSAGYEIIASPEVFIATVAQRTRDIRLGTGVSSLPYHHPLLLADRMVLLDHLTKGRTMFGVGPGALPSDAFMMGIDPLRQREMMDESLEVIIALLAGDEPVSTTSSPRKVRSSWLRKSIVLPPNASTSSPVAIPLERRSSAPTRSSSSRRLKGLVR